MEDENKTADQEGMIAYEKETGNQAVIDGELTEGFKAWALKNSEKLEDVEEKVEGEKEETDTEWAEEDENKES